MKQYLLTYLFLLFTLALFAQSSVFVMVDVSGSTTKYSVIRQEAEQITKDLIKGKYSAQNYSSEWTWLDATEEINEIINGNTTPLINPNEDGFLMIMPFGIRSRYEGYQVQKIINLSQVDDFFSNNYPKAFKDLYTYDDIARAMTASLAKGSAINIRSYFLIEISDQLTDTESVPPQYTDFEEKIMAKYGTNKATERKIATLDFKSGEIEYKVIIKKINVTNLNIQQANPNSNNVTTKSLTLKNPKGNTSKAKPQKQNPGIVAIRWSCLGCDSTTKFSIRVNNLDNKKVNFGKTTSDMNERFNNIKKTGTYKVTVSAPGIGTQNGYFKIAGESSSGGGFFVILVLLGLGIGGYMLYKKQQSKPNDWDNNRDSFSNKPNDTFSPPSNNSGDEGVERF